MAFSKVTSYESPVNFLESEIGLITKTYTGEQAKAVLDSTTGRKLIKAGTVYPANDATAKGIVFETVDMTDDAKAPISLIVAGRIYENRLPATVQTAAKGVLPQIVLVQATAPNVAKD